MSLCGFLTNLIVNTGIVVRSLLDIRISRDLQHIPGQDENPFHGSTLVLVSLLVLLGSTTTFNFKLSWLVDIEHKPPYLITSPWNVKAYFLQKFTKINSTSQKLLFIITINQKTTKDEIENYPTNSVAYNIIKSLTICNKSPSFLASISQTFCCVKASLQLCNWETICRKQWRAVLSLGNSSWQINSAGFVKFTTSLNKQFCSI